MAAESVGSGVGSPSQSPYPTRPLWEEKIYSPNAPASSPNSVPFQKYPQRSEFPCKVCGHPCVVRTSHTDRNPNRDFYTCASGMKCNMFQWCDEVGKIQPRGVNSPVKQNNLVKHNSPMKPGLQRDVASSQNPICTCGAGPCRVETKQNGEFKGRKYYACHLKKGQGICTHFEWCDDRGETKGKDVLVADETVVPNLVEGSPSKRKRVEGWLNECIASPTLGCYINEKQPVDCEISPRLTPTKASPTLGCYINEKRPVDCEISPWLTPVKGSPLPLQTEPRVECSPIQRPSVSSPMKRLSLTEGGSSRNPERCVVCGQVGHGVNDCASLAIW